MWGSAPDATLAENALMGYEDSDEFSKKGILNTDKVINHAINLISKFRVKADSYYDADGCGLAAVQVGMLKSLLLQEKCLRKLLLLLLVNLQEGLI